MALQSRALLILTRPAYAATRFAAEARARLGADQAILSAPLMAPVFYKPQIDPPAPDGVIFTSETGVAGLSALVDWRVEAICVGPLTAKVAQDHGWPATSLGGDAERLLAALTAAKPKGRWIHARGRDAAGSLATRLAQTGMAITEAILYAQEPQPMAPELRAAFHGTTPLLLPIFSPRSGRLLIEALGDLAAVTAPLHIAAISPAAVATVSGLAASSLEIAATPDGPGMLDALERLTIGTA